MLPPVLEIYVVHHPEDAEGAEAAAQIFRHFHGTSFSGLIGGAIEVYVRAQAWRAGGEAPRPIPMPGTLEPNGVQSAQIVAVVPVMSLALAQAVEASGAWAAYLNELVTAQTATPAQVGIFPLMVDREATDGTQLGAIFGAYQQIAAASGLAVPEPPAELRCRDLSQAIAQLISKDRLKVFISHTKRAGFGEEQDVPALIRTVREIIAETRLAAFFDAQDLQPGQDWDEELRRQAAQSCLLVLRTDLYASRMWCQREMLTAKCAGVPIVILDSLGHGEGRGSFLMDHIPRMPVRHEEDGWVKGDLRRGLNLLVDECLKRQLWLLQQKLSEARSEIEVTWWAPHAPEPVTLTAWLTGRKAANQPVLGEKDLRILHPDPPLGPDEREELAKMLRLMGHTGALDIMTPRSLAARGA